MISKKICTFQKITIFYHRTNDLNLLHFMAALKDGLVDTSNYGPFSISLPGMLAFSEPNSGWNAGFSGAQARTISCMPLARHVPDSLRTWFGDGWEKPGPPQ